MWQKAAVMTDFDARLIFPYTKLSSHYFKNGEYFHG